MTCCLEAQRVSSRLDELCGRDASHLAKLSRTKTVSLIQYFTSPATVRSPYMSVEVEPVWDFDRGRRVQLN